MSRKFVFVTEITYIERCFYNEMVGYNVTVNDGGF